jgi:hypothetical protein
VAIGCAAQVQVVDADGGALFFGVRRGGHGDGGERESEDQGAGHHVYSPWIDWVLVNSTCLSGMHDYMSRFADYVNNALQKVLHT